MCLEVYGPASLAWAAPGPGACRRASRAYACGDSPAREASQSLTERYPVSQRSVKVEPALYGVATVALLPNYPQPERQPPALWWPSGGREWGDGWRVGERQLGRIQYRRASESVHVRPEWSGA